MAERKDLATSIGLLVLRVGMGGYMLTHGIGKLGLLNADETGSPGPKWADPIGVGDDLSLLLVLFAEIVCAVLVIAGLATRLAAIPIVIAMCVAAFVVHGNDPWTMSSGAAMTKQPALMFAIAFLTLVFTGAGRISLDATLLPRLKKRRASH